MLLFHQFAKVHQVSLRNVTLCSECLALCFKCPTKWCSTKLTLLLVTHGVLPFEYKKYSTKQIDLQLTFSVFWFFFFCFCFMCFSLFCFCCFSFFLFFSQANGIRMFVLVTVLLHYLPQQPVLFNALKLSHFIFLFKGLPCMFTNCNTTNVFYRNLQSL